MPNTAMKILFTGSGMTSFSRQNFLAHEKARNNNLWYLKTENLYVWLKAEDIDAFLAVYLNFEIIKIFPEFFIY